MSRTAPALSLALLTALAAGGCVERTKMNEIEKAKLVNEKRLEARDLLFKIKASDARDLKLLERYVKVHGETTEILPSTCPRCWADYGEALSMIGFYWWYEYDGLLADAEKDGQDRERLLQEAEGLQEKWEDYFTRSNHAFDTHFRSPGVTFVHPYAYERVMRHYELMGNYDRALYYLQKCLDSHPLIEDLNRQKFEKLRRLYLAERQRQKERGVDPDEEGRERRSPNRGQRQRHKDSSPPRPLAFDGE